MVLRLLQIVGRENMIRINTSSNNYSPTYRFGNILDYCDKNPVISKTFIENAKMVMDTFDPATSKITKESIQLNNYLIRSIEKMKREVIEHITSNKGKSTNKEIKQMTEFITGMSYWTNDKDDSIRSNKISNDSTYNSINFYKTFIQNLVSVFPNMIQNKVDFLNPRLPSYWGLSQIHTRDIKKIISDQYECLRSFYDDKSLYNILIKVQSSCESYVRLANETPSFTSIHYKEKEIIPIFDERTSRFLFEYYLLKICVEYIDLSEEETMIVKETTIPENTTDLFTVEYLEEQNKTRQYEVNTKNTKEIVVKGNVKELKQKVSTLLLCFIKIMSNYKSVIDISYQQVKDNVFKLKEKEKNIITDRLKMKTDEERDVDTILKINKLGDWNKGLQKGLRDYDKDYYDNEHEFMETMQKYEKATGKKADVSMDEFNDFRDDYVEEIRNNEQMDQEDYDMTHMTEDYENGNDYEGSEIENYNDYD